MKIFVSRNIHPVGLKLLKDKGYQLDIYNSSLPISRLEFLERSKNVDALITLITEKVDSEFLNIVGENLKIVANYAIGFNNLDLKALKEKNIFATNTPSNLAESVAEFTVAIIINLVKKINIANDFVLSGNYTGFDPNLFVTQSIEGMTLGIIGAGRIGTSTAHKCKLGLGMDIIYTDETRNYILESNYNAKFVTLDELLKKSDVVSIHTPLTEKTKHLISDRELSLMKKHSYLVNTSRGLVVDEIALVNALKNKTIAGAGLDVFENEPNLTKGLIECKNVILTPHIASATSNARKEMSKIVAINIIEALEGRTPPNILNF